MSTNELIHSDQSNTQVQGRLSTTVFNLKLFEVILLCIYHHGSHQLPIPKHQALVRIIMYHVCTLLLSNQPNTT